MTLTYILLKQLLSQLHFTLVKAGAIVLKKSKIEVEQFHVSLYKQVLGVSETTSNTKVLAELGRLPFKIYIETQIFKYLQRLPFLEEDTFLRKAINEEIKINSGRIANLKYILDSYGLFNLMINIFKVVERDLSKKDYKNKQFLSKKS